MKALTTATVAVSLPIFSLNKSRNSPSRRLLRFSTSPKIFVLQDEAMGLVLSAANVRGWTTGMRVAFTCKVCGQRTTRAINPHAYTDGTVFVQVHL
ncbi:hypothetical protein PHJA_000157300 [Phtheirospermum japonicum]|uniref:DNL-type domain-containing protein n=1 Tax=Phtheirospermum japonicum TaxID=374723 RepID=A0A830B487_9LAMI|nr:hypothetical protein PHJA_000157300 [Phtheirospermum japonicum]